MQSQQEDGALLHRLQRALFDLAQIRTKDDKATRTIRRRYKFKKEEEEREKLSRSQSLRYGPCRKEEGHGDIAADIAASAIKTR